MAIGQGPAAIVALTGNRVNDNGSDGRTLWVYEIKIVVGSSEVGSPPIPLDELEFVHRLNGGDQALEEGGHFVPPSEVMRRVVNGSELEMVGDSRMVDLDDSPYEIYSDGSVEAFSKDKLVKLWNQVGGGQHVMEVLKHMALTGKEPVEGMGDDRPLAILSSGRLRFAEYATPVVGWVTDPPVDSLREGMLWI